MSAVLAQDQSARADLSLFLSAYGAYAAHGIMPTDGGLVEQSSQFIQAVGIADGERARWDQVRDDHITKEREKAERKAKAGAKPHARH